MTASHGDATGATDLDWGVARGIAGFRWLALTWATTVAVITRDDVSGPMLGAALLTFALAITAATTEASIRRRRWVFGRAAVIVELAAGASMLLLDGFVYDKPHSQSVGSARLAGSAISWPALRPRRVWPCCRAACCLP